MTAKSFSTPLQSLPDPAAPALELRLRGAAEVRLHGRKLPCPDRVLRLLAVLALDGPQSRLQVADLLWDGSSSQVLHNLRMALLRLRQLLGAEAPLLQSQRGALHLDMGRVWVDVLHVGTEPFPVEADWPEFMPAQRTGGSERWLEWAAGKAELYPPQRRRCLPATALFDPHSEPLLRARPADQRAAEQADAAMKALVQGKTNLAQTLAQDALTLVKTGEGAALALDVLTHVALEQDEYQQAKQLNRRAMECAPAPLADVCYTAAYLADLDGQAEQAERLALLGLAHQSRGQSPALWLATIASSYDTRQDFHTARLWHELALNAARRHPARYQQCGATTFYLWHLNTTGFAPQAQELAREALDLGEFSMTPYIYNSLAVAQVHQGKLERALETYQRGQHLFSESLTLMASAKMARIYHLLGETGAAIERLLGHLPRLEHSDDGRARFEWAVAALTVAPAELGPTELGPAALRGVQGFQTNEPNLIREFRELRARHASALTPGRPARSGAAR
ncbi:hypothetical protein [Deinococcus fonticola]|uniref:hypothetical protein n=1 Tax=Deinococcus fonticola TaxID=2528713 RepID=UPI001074C05A|nr:hypothetical protein [Deinococcus fonticola]